MLARLFLVIITFSELHCINIEEKIEPFCNINCKKAIQNVSEKFLSISIDPAVLLAGVNLSEKSLLLAKHLSPAYIRIAGSSTQFVKYADNEDKSGNYLSEDGNNVVVTPSMWFGINEWLKLANLTPVFGINDADTNRGVWNPKSALPLLEISDKLNISCYWQLGYDSSNKSEIRYTQDLNIFHYILAAFSERNETWKIVGSDISRLAEERIENTMDELNDVATAVMWEPMDLTEESFPRRDMAYKILHQTTKPKVKIWTTVPKSSEPVTFSSALLWANQIGSAAKTGFEVVFRQPRMHELFSDSPAYWFSLLHKKLMGCIVLEAKTTTYRKGTNIYAHCTRQQNSFVRRGALTIMIVNSNEEKYRVKVKLGTTLPEKSMEVQTYLLTSSNLNSTEVLLNEKFLTADILLEKNPFEPKIRRAKSTSHVLLTLPEMSIGFFVLPGARASVCINEEKETDLLLEEMEENQNMPLSEEVALQFGTRASFGRNHILDEITQKMKDEMRSDEKYYNNPSLKSRIENLKEKLKEESPEKKVNDKGRKFFIDRVKLAEKHKKLLDLERKKEDLRNFLLERSRFNKPASKDHKLESKAKNLELTSEEVEKILKDRAKARAAQRNIVFTDEELNALIHKASKKFATLKIKRSIPSDQKKNKRDINMQLLESKCEKFTPEHLKKEDCAHFRKKNVIFTRNIQKRSIRSPRDINFKMLNYKSKIEDTKQKMREKKYEIIGNAQTLKENMKDKYNFIGNSQTLKENIKDKILKLKNNRRFRRDINMELLKVKSEGLKKKSQKESTKKESKRTFKNKEAKEATIRKAGQTSADLYEDESNEEDQEEPVTTKTEVFAELANSEEYDDVDLFSTTPKSKTLKLFDKKTKLDPFSIDQSTRDIVKPHYKKNRKDKKKSKIEDQLQFLTTSEEFTDIEDDFPCIHEFFGQDSGSIENERTKKKILPELNEISSAEKLGKKKSKQKKMNTLFSHEDMRRKRNLDKTLRLNEPSTERTTVMKFNILEVPKVKVGKDGLTNKIFGPVCTNLRYNKKVALLHGNLDNSKQNLPSKEKVEKFSDGSKLTKHEKEKKEKMVELNESIISDEEMSSERLRRKRETGTLNDENIVVDLKSDIKQHFKELKQMLANDTLRFEEIRKKQKMKLVDLKNRTHGEISKEAGDISTEAHENEPEKRNEILGRIKLLKQKIQQRKKEIDAVLTKDLKLHRKTDDKKHGLIKHKMLKEKETLTKMAKEMEIENSTDENGIKLHPVINDKPTVTAPDSEVYSYSVTESTKGPIPTVIKLTKRSIFDSNKHTFGNYQPLTNDLKVWKPYDILSLKRDLSFLNTKKLKPPNDYQIFKHIFDKNNFLNLRKKRKIDSDINDIENDIDSYFNEIEKNDKTTDPKLNLEEGDYKLSIPNTHKFEMKKINRDLPLDSIHHKIEQKTKKSEMKDRNITSEVDPPDNSGISVIQNYPNNKQKIPIRQDLNIFDRFMKDLTGCLSKLGKQLGSYVKFVAFN